MGATKLKPSKGQIAQQILEDLQTQRGAEGYAAEFHAMAVTQDLSKFARRVWKIVDPAKYVHNWHIDAVSDHLMAVNDGTIRRLLINLPPRMMKALTIDTPVLTTWGWKAHGDLRPGDFVFGPDGQPKRVLACTPHRSEMSYDVRFDDGAQITAGEGHLWAIERDKACQKPKWHRTRIRKIVTTRELIGASPGPSKSEPRPDRIPMNAPLAMPPRRFLIEPYVLGVWLGDGMSNSGQIGVGDQDVDHFKALGTVTSTRHLEGMQPFHRILIPELQTKLRVLGLLGNKHIPADYFEASEAQRWDLLRGLMDTDGHVDKAGHCSFSNKSDVIARGMVQLLRSLGIKAHDRLAYKTLKGRQFGPYHQIGFMPPEGARVFGLARKAARVKGAKSERTRHRYVDSVTPVGVRMVNCITVEGALYLAGHDLVPTHNSLLVSGIWPAWTWAQQRDPEFPLMGPQVRFLCLSYSSELALDMARMHRKIIDSVWYRQRFPHVRIDPRQDLKEAFATTEMGVRYAVGMGGSVLGRGGDIKIIDDPHKPDEVESELVRQAVIDQYDEELTLRITDPKTNAEVVIMQRLAENDLSGHILEQEDPNLVHLCLPMEYDPQRHCVTMLGWQDPRGCDEDGEELPERDEDGIPEPGSPLALREGTLIWPDRFPEEEVDKLKSRLGPYGYAGRLQQTPAPRGGGILRSEWWRTWRSNSFPDFSTVLVSLDTSSTEKETNDEAALTAWGAWADDDGKPQIMLIDAWEGFLEFDRLVERTAKMCQMPGGNTSAPADVLLVEAKNIGHPVMSEMRRRYGNRNWSVVPFNPMGDKVTRAIAVQGLLSGSFRRDPDTGIQSWSGGVIWAPVTDWAQMVIDRCSQFPRAKRKGIVDTTTQAWKYLRDYGIIIRSEEIEWERDEELEYKKPLKPLYNV